MARIRKGDTVEILKGKDKGKTGVVLHVFPQRGKVLVENVNQYKRHIKSRAQGQKSEIRVISKPLYLSSVMLVDSTTKKRTKVGFRVAGEDKVRIAKISGQEIK